MSLEQIASIRSRRRFLDECAGGIGLAALWHLMALEGRAAEPLPGFNPMAPRAPPLRTQGQERHLFLHGRCPQPARPV